MIPGAFAYHRPKSVAEAVGLLADLGDDARALAGGHSLIPMMKLRLAKPEHLVDLAGIGDLKGARAEGGDIVIGSMTTQNELLRSDLLAAYSTTCLRRVWKAARFSWWLTTMLHKFPDTDAFGHGLQRAEFEYLRSSPVAQAAFAENYTGLPLEI